MKTAGQEVGEITLRLGVKDDEFLLAATLSSALACLEDTSCYAGGAHVARDGMKVASLHQPAATEALRPMPARN